MKELVTKIVQSLVDDETKVEVREIKGNQTDIFEVSTSKEDIGKVIGKQGRTAKAVRTILKAASKKNGKKYILNIL